MGKVPRQKGCLLTALFALPLVLAATLGAQGSPINDDFQSAIQLAGTNLTVSGSNDNATKETGEPNHAGNLGGRSVWWYWQSPESGYVTISTAGSISSTYLDALDTVLAVYVGDSVSSLTQVASNDDGPFDYTSKLTFKATAGTTYRIVVDGYRHGTTAEDADSGSISLSLSFSPGHPIAPPWRLVGVDDMMVDSTNFAGKVILLNFWATWCVPCIVEIPDLIALQTKYAADGLVIVGISVDASLDGFNPPTSLVQSFVATHLLNYPVVMSRPSGGSVEYDYGGIPYIPETFVIDRQNRIVESFTGTQTYATFERSIKPLLYSNLQAHCVISDGQLRIFCDATQSQFSIETTTNLTSGQWTIVDAAFQSDGTNQFVNLPLEGGSRYFRLASQ